MSDKECQYFHFIGAPNCDNCGRSIDHHIGHRVLRQGAGPFAKKGEPDPWEDLSFAEFDQRIEDDKYRRRMVKVVTAHVESMSADQIKRAYGSLDVG